MSRQLVHCKHGIQRGSNCCHEYKPVNNLYTTGCCCLNCTNSVWLGDEKSARNPYAALPGDPLLAVELLREESLDEVLSGKKRKTFSKF